MSNEEPVLEWLEPPDGGLQTLRDRMARRARGRFIAGGCAVVALVAVALVRHSPEPSGPGPSLQDRIARHVATRDHPGTTLRVIDGAALELPSPSSNARIYLVSTRQEEPDSGAG